MLHPHLHATWKKNSKSRLSKSHSIASVLNYEILKSGIPKEKSISLTMKYSYQTLSTSLTIILGVLQSLPLE